MIPELCETFAKILVEQLKNRTSKEVTEDKICPESSTVDRDKLEMFIIKIIPSIAEEFNKARGKDIFVMGLVSAVVNEIVGFLKEAGVKVV